MKIANLIFAVGLVAWVSNLPAEGVTRYVALQAPNPQPPHTSWATAATSIQQAVEVAEDGDVILVTNGVYEFGGKVEPGYMLSNRVVIDKAVTVRSVNGPEATVIRGDAQVRCAWLGSNAVLCGFTLTGGSTLSSGDEEHERSGGGAWCHSGAVLSNCVLCGNSANNNGGGVYRGTLYWRSITCNWARCNGGAAWGATLYNCIVNDNQAEDSGGGTYAGTLYNCILRGNSAQYRGGGAYSGTLYNCTLRDNWAGEDGGGACDSTLSNCILWRNQAPQGTNWAEGALEYCCTTPLPPGEGNICADPFFLDRYGKESRLGYGSPCIDAGTNQAWMTGLSDLGGRPRIVGERVDMGAYEYDKEIDDSDDDGMTDGWEENYGLDPTNEVDGAEDPDGDGMDNRSEYVADTVPTNDLSSLRVTELEYGHSCRVSFMCTNTRSYALEYTDELMSGQWRCVEGLSNVAGDASGVISVIDSNTDSAVRCYRIRVNWP